MAGLSLQHIYKIYNNTMTAKEVRQAKKAGIDIEPKPAVSDFCMEIEDKEFIVFVGPSGCGKSTTLRMIAGLEEITKGDLYIDGKLMNEVEPKDRDIAMVFQNYALYPHMTVYENMAFALQLRKINKDEIDRRVKDAAKMLDIEQYLSRKPKALSGGQRQRVALGRALVRNPKVFLLDEPLSNLDAKLRAAMRTEITKLHKKLQTTFIYVTHDQVEAMTMGTRIVVMKDGFIQQIGAPQYIYDHPANKFVGGFIGTPQMNFYEGEINKDGKITFANDQTITLPEDKLCQLKDFDNSKKIILGIRPEDLHADVAFLENCNNKVTAKIEVKEELGSETLIYANLDMNAEDGVIDEDSKTKLIAKVDSRTVLGGVEEVVLGVDAKHVHIFDLDTEMTMIK